MLLDLYLEAVRRLLPRTMRDDVIAELRDALLSQIEEEQAERGRPLTGDEVGAMLKRYGAPPAVAARYGAREHLIGPRVYPHYILVVKLVMGVVGLVTMLMAAPAAFSEEPLRVIARALGVGALIAFGNLTLVTLIFARIEGMNGRVDAREEWNPATLDRLPRRRERIARSEAVTGLCVSAFWIVWWIDVLPINRWLLWNRLPLEPGPIWDQLTPLVVGLMATNLAINAVAILRPRLVKFYEGSGLLIDCGIVAAAAVVLRRAPAFVVVTDPASPAVWLARLFDVMLVVGLVALALLALASIAFTIRRWVVIARRQDRGMALV